MGQCRRGNRLVSMLWGERCVNTMDEGTIGMVVRPQSRSIRGSAWGNQRMKLIKWDFDWMDLTVSSCIPTLITLPLEMCLEKFCLGKCVINCKVVYKYEVVLFKSL